jgi:hypothetical protein
MSKPTVDSFAASLLGHITDPTTNRAKDELAKPGQDIARVPFVRGAMHEVTVAAASAERLTHKLGRTPQGWIVVDVEGGANTVYRTGWDVRVITLQNDSAIDITLKVWVF